MVVLCAGPERAAQTIREALAKGADRAIHIEIRPQFTRYPGRSEVLAAAASAEKPDLILTGLQSDDLGSGQTGVVMAELLGTAFDHHHAGGNPGRQHSCEAGTRERLVSVHRHAAACGVHHTERLNKLRYATLMGIKKAKNKEIRRVTVAELGRAAAAVASIEKSTCRKEKADPNIRRRPEGRGGAAGREVEVRSAGVMSILAVLEQQAAASGIGCPGRRWPPLSSWARAWRPVEAALREGNRRVNGGSEPPRKSTKSRGIEHELLDVHRRWLHGRDRTANSEDQAQAGPVSPHLSGPRLRSQAGYAIFASVGSDVVASRVEGGALILVRSFFKAN